MNKPRQARKTIRHPEFDYATNAAYFVTICTAGRRCVLGRVVGGDVVLTAAGRMVKRAWEELETLYPGVWLREFVIMPNHLHATVVLLGDGISLIDLVRHFKTWTTRQYRRGVRDHGWPPIAGPLWQRSFWDHIIRNDHSRERIAAYIAANPARWAADRLNPRNPL